MSGHFSLKGARSALVCALLVLAYAASYYWQYTLDPAPAQRSLVNTLTIGFAAAGLVVLGLLALVQRRLNRERPLA